jgi:hypothetical protein
LQLRLEVDNSLINSPTSLISFYRLDNGEKLPLPVELQTKMRIAEQEATLAKQEAAFAQQEATFSKQKLAAQQKSLELAAQLAAYQARFGSLDS